MRWAAAMIVLTFVGALASGCTRTAEVPLERSASSGSTPTPTTQRASETVDGEAATQLVAAQPTPAPEPTATGAPTATPIGRQASTASAVDQTFEPVESYAGFISAPDGTTVHTLSLGLEEAAGGFPIGGEMLAAFDVEDDGVAVTMDLVGDLAVLDRLESAANPRIVELVVAVHPDLVAALAAAADRDALVLAPFDQRRESYWFALAFDGEDLAQGAIAPGDYVSINIDDGRAPERPFDTIQAGLVWVDEEADRWMVNVEVPEDDLALIAEVLVRPSTLGAAGFMPAETAGRPRLVEATEPAGPIPDGFAAHDLTLPAWHALGGDIESGDVVTVIATHTDIDLTVGWTIADVDVLDVATTVPVPQVAGDAIVQLALDPEQASAIERTLATDMIHLARPNADGTHDLMFEMSSTRAARGQVRAGDVAHIIGPETDDPVTVYIPAAEVVAVPNDGQSFWPVLKIPSEYVDEMAAFMYDVEFGLFLTGE